jgi:hypothetical protein
MTDGTDDWNKWAPPAATRRSPRVVDYGEWPDNRVRETPAPDLRKIGPYMVCGEDGEEMIYIYGERAPVTEEEEA